MKYAHVMLDIETLATSDRAVVLTIGAVAFAPVIGLEPTGFHVSLSVAAQPAREIDADTVRWWFAQDGTVRDAAFAGAMQPAAALDDLIAYVQRHARGAAVWANPPQFDITILRSLAKDVGTDVPWHFRDERCFRTLKRLVSDVTLPVRENRHDALADARWQAEAALALFRKLP